MFGVLLLLTAFASLLYAFYRWATLYNDFFENRGIKYMTPKFFTGNAGDFFFNKITAIDHAHKLYQSFPGESIYGYFYFRTPQYVIRDPDAIKQITVKDFDHFEDHHGFLDVSCDKFWGNSLFFLKGVKWRQMRATLSPAFTGSKMRQMFELVVDCVDDVVNHHLEKAESGEKVNVEMKDFFSRYANDVIATSAFGIKVNSFTDPENEFYLNGKQVLNFVGLIQLFKVIIFNKLPFIAKMFDMSLLDGSTAKSFRSTILDTMKVRKQNNIYRPDMINLLMQIREGTLDNNQTNEKAEEKDGFATVEESDVGKVTVNRTWNDDEIVAQCFLFFVAGFDTGSTLLTFVSYELVRNPDIQQKLYEEIIETQAKLGGKRISYDALQKMKYMDQVVCEGLRKWPPATQLDRVCVKDYLYDDGNKRKFMVEKGKAFIISVYGIHHDPKYFTEPEKFDPERFSDSNKNNIIPGTFIPFGVGPRNCIGSRFALMEIKAILYYLLLNFSFEPNAKTEIPVQFKKVAFSITTKNGMHLELKPRKH